jgi:DNA-binding transcriptional MerR regulator
MYHTAAFKPGGVRRQSLLKTKTILLDSGTRSSVYNSGVAVNDTNSRRFLRPGELARLAGVSVDTLRHYERKGLINPRRAANRYREYPEQAVDRVLMVRRALSVGFSLDDLARIFKERDSGGSPCRTVRQLAKAKLTEIEQMIEELGSVRDDLKAILIDWDIRLERAGTGQPARLLEALAATTRPMEGLQVESCKLKVGGSRRSALQEASFRTTRKQGRKKQ